MSLAQQPHHAPGHQPNQGGVGIFPLLRGQGFPEKGPNWSNTTIRTKSGRRFVKQNWTFPIWDFTVKYSTISLRRNEWAQLVHFFNAHAGQLTPFYYYDPQDHRVENQPIEPRGDGVTTNFQLLRGVSYGGYTWTEPVFGVKPPIHVYVNGAEVTFTDLGLGMIELSAAPAIGATVSWTGVFLFLCAFTQDDLPMKQLNALLYSNDGLSFSSIRP